MIQCPRCGRYLRFKLTYNCGTPVVGYDCVCGYDSFKNWNNIVITDVTNTLSKEEKQNESSN